MVIVSFRLLYCYLDVFHSLVRSRLNVRTTVVKMCENQCHSQLAAVSVSDLDLSLIWICSMAFHVWFVCTSIQVVEGFVVACSANPL